MHGDLGTPTKALVIEDVESELNTLFEAVLTLTEHIFAALCLELIPEERTVMCGVYKGRIYQRSVCYSPSLTFNDGLCKSLQWFHNETGLECPLRHNCGAYHAATPNETQSHNKAVNPSGGSGGN